MRPAWTIARSIWLANRRGFIGLISAVLVCALAFRLTGPAFWSGDMQEALTVLPMGLSIFLTFVFCGFTEADSRKRSTGFPSRLFTLPVATRTLVVAPMMFGVVAVCVVYFLWAKVVLPAVGRELPLAWPSLYLATGMICYLSIVWSMARFRTARLIVLGISGCYFAISWVAFRNEFERLLIPWMPADMPVQPVLCALLVAMSMAAFLVALVAVGSQRRGGSGEWHGWRKIIEWATDAFPRRQRRFASPGESQMWFEWRRHGTLLPLATTGVLLLIMVPAPFVAPISADGTALVVCWILALPLLLAFVLGKGFGKADPWSNEPGLPLFLATRPLGNTTWISAKMKAAAMASLLTWLVVACLTPWWICMWCDWQTLGKLWKVAETVYPASVLYALPVLAFGLLALLTWRLLVGSLYIGLSGRPWMLNVAACGIFAAFFGGMFLMVFLSQAKEVGRFVQPPPWFGWLACGLFGTKITAALLLSNHAHNEGWVEGRAVWRYLVMWFLGTAFLSLAVWVLIPVEGWARWLSALLALFGVPLLRVAYAPTALARNRRR